MRTSDKLQVISQILNFTIFLYFSIILIKTNPFNVIDMLISAIGLIGSITIAIIGTIIRIREAE